MTLGRNLLAGLANSIWSALIGFAVVPFYLKYLGIEAYGLIGFFMTLQVMFQLLDMGLAPTMNREVARSSASGDVRQVADLLHTLAVVYWSVAVAIAATVALGSGYLALGWLQSRTLPIETIENALLLMGVVIAVRWPIALYQSALIGAQRITLYSAVNMSMVGLGALGGVSVLALVSNTLEAFFAWQACIGMVHVLLMRYVAWRVVGRPAEGCRFSLESLRRIWRFALGMTAIGLTGLLFSQLDKVILSRMLDLDDFGRYTLAVLVVSSLYILITPVFNIVFPRFSGWVASGQEGRLRANYHQGSRVLASVLFPAATLLCVFAQDLVWIWTGNIEVAVGAAPVIGLLAYGSALHGVMHFPYALQLAFATTKLSLLIYAVLIVVMLPLFVVLPMARGAVGGGLAWLAAMVFYLLFGTWMMHRRLLRGEGWKWLMRGVVLPLAVSGFVGLVLYHIAPQDGAWGRLTMGLVSMTLLSAALILVPVDSRKLVIERLKVLF